MESFDVAVIGAGPAGLMAAVYAGRYKLKTIVFGEIHGGTISGAHVVENFPAYTSISGYALSQKMVEQVAHQGVKIRTEKIINVENKGHYFSIHGEESTIHTKKVILAVGRKTRLLGLPREKELKGKGISYCATCDAAFFKDKIVGVVGGSDAALSSAVLLGDIAKKVYILYRKDKFFRPEPAWLELVQKSKKIEPIFNVTVTEFLGKDGLDAVMLSNGNKLHLDGLFIEIGSEPEIEFLQKFGVSLNEAGYVKVDAKMHTNIHGIFSAGDLNADNFKQAVVAVAEGAIAANSAYEEIKRDSIGM